MSKKTILFLVSVFIIINAAVYFVTLKNAQQRIDLVLEDSIKTLNTHYEIVLHNQKITASTMYKSTISNKRVLEIVKEAKDLSEEKRKSLRAELYKLLEKKYERGIEKGVFQYHIVFPDNISFLRMHKPSKFGDDLTDVRSDFKYVNETHEAVRGFVQGRTSHGFRNTFPLFSKDGEYIGAIEVSFSSDNLQWFLTHISHIHSHFLVDKDVFRSKAWKRDDLSVNYMQSAEHAKYMIAFLDEYHTKDICIIQNAKRLEKIRETLDKNIAKGEEFATYLKHNQHVNVFAYLPIKDFEGKTAAWLVSYDNSEFIELTITNIAHVRVIALIFSLILIYFMAKQSIAKYKIEVLLNITEKKAGTDELTGIYNRRKFNEIFAQEMDKARRYKHPLSIAIIDIDKFKNINDAYGHLAGDDILVMISQSISKHIRHTDTFARWGGEEFVILFEETPLSEAKTISIKIKELVASLKHKEAGSVTISIGVTQLRDDDTEDSIFTRCDKALYNAKENGRNRVEIL
jgi:diguanylate cyclase (GGDEF)-like protein